VMKEHSAVCSGKKRKSPGKCQRDNDRRRFLKSQVREQDKMKEIHGQLCTHFSIEGVGTDLLHSSDVGTELHIIPRLGVQSCEKISPPYDRLRVIPTVNVQLEDRDGQIGSVKDKDRDYSLNARIVPAVVETNVNPINVGHSGSCSYGRGSLQDISVGISDIPHPMLNEMSHQQRNNLVVNRCADGEGRRSVNRENMEFHATDSVGNNNIHYPRDGERDIESEQDIRHQNIPTIS
ncbi:hypothetical protein KI387_021597, partial [Taxus chinensis]